MNATTTNQGAEAMHESHILRWAEYHVTRLHWAKSFKDWTSHLSREEEARLALRLSGVVEA